MAALDTIKALLASAEGDGAHGHTIYPLLRDGLLALAEEIDKSLAKKPAPVFTPPPSAVKKADAPSSMKA